MIEARSAIARAPGRRQRPRASGWCARASAATASGRRGCRGRSARPRRVGHRAGQRGDRRLDALPGRAARRRLAVAAASRSCLGAAVWPRARPLARPRPSARRLLGQHLEGRTRGRPPCRRARRPANRRSAPRRSSGVIGPSLPDGGRISVRPTIEGMPLSSSTETSASPIAELGDRLLGRERRVGRGRSRPRPAPPSARAACRRAARAARGWRAAPARRREYRPGSA